MMASVFDVAAYILQSLYAYGEKTVTTWKLQKLVYYSQAWSLVWDDQPLFEERLEAWANGPVCPALYSVHRGRFKVAKWDIPNADPDALTFVQKETIDAVVDHYGKKTAQYLSALTHNEMPWIEARCGLPAGERGSNEITQDAMAEYYGGIVDAQEGIVSHRVV